MIEGLKNGLYQEWYSDGKLKRKGKYLNNTQVGDWTVWYDNGQKKFDRTFKEGKENGQKSYEWNYKDGKEISSKSWKEDGSLWRNN